MDDPGPRPMTKAEWDEWQLTSYDEVPHEWDRITATLSQLFEKIERLERYRVRTQGFPVPLLPLHTGTRQTTDDIARDCGIE